MHPQIRMRLNELKTLILSHPTVREFSIRGEELTMTRSYLRIRLVLQSQDTIESFIYLIDQDGIISLKDYTLHWQQEGGALVQRWDTAPHHPELVNFPYHTHKATGEVEATLPHTWESFLALIERVLTDSLKTVISC
jgi:hypothetical protein